MADVPSPVSISRVVEAQHKKCQVVQVTAQFLVLTADTLLNASQNTALKMKLMLSSTFLPFIDSMYLLPITTMHAFFFEDGKG